MIYLADFTDTKGDKVIVLQRDPHFMWSVCLDIILSRMNSPEIQDRKEQTAEIRSNRGIFKKRAVKKLFSDFEWKVLFF